MNQATDAEPQAASPAPGKAPRLALLIATGFGLGYLPKAPGTWGSLGGVILAWAIVYLPHAYDLFGARGSGPTMAARYGVVLTMVFQSATITISLLGVLAASRSQDYLGAKDPQQIVIDEISGQMITFLGLGLYALEFTERAGWKYLAVGFILFRLFDIWKPWPARRAEKLPGGWGIMADDWVAGVYAALGLWAARAIGL